MKNLKKALAFVLTALMLVTMLGGCANSGKRDTGTTANETSPATGDESVTSGSSGTDTEAETDSTVSDDTVIRIGTLKGPTGIGMVKLMEDTEANKQYNVELYSAPDAITSAIISNSLDVAAVPVNLASVINNKKSGEFQTAAVNTLGVLYILENGNTVNSVSDLRSKTIYATGQAATPEYVLRYILEKNGIDPDKDVTIEYLSEHSELAALMSSGKAKIGMLPEPNVTAVLTKNEGVRIALDLTDEWQAIGGGSLVQGCIIVRKEFAENHKELLDKFLEDYSASVDYVNGNVDEAAELVAEKEIVPAAAVAKKAIPNCNIVCITGSEMASLMDGMLKVLYDASPSSVGGKLPESSFYYIPSEK